MRGQRYVAITSALMLAGQVHAQGAIPHAGDDAATINRRIQTANDAVARDNADRLAAWERERARVTTENDASKAAFAQQQAAYARDMANWRAETARLAQAAPPRGKVPKPAAAEAATGDRGGSTTAGGKRICRTETVTGSLVQKRKVCTTVAERDSTARSAQGVLRGMTSGGCTPGGPGC